MNASCESTWFLKAIACALILGAQPAYASGISKRRTFESSGKQIAVELFFPKGNALVLASRLPVVIILHAQAELRTAVTSSEMLRQICRNMAE